MTNQTEIFSVVDVHAGVAIVTGNVNDFVVACIASGYINFHIAPVVVTPQYDTSGVPTGKYWYSVQVNYYNPQIYS